MQDVLERLGIAAATKSGKRKVYSPVDGSLLAQVQDTGDVKSIIRNSVAAFEQWRAVPAPKRGELIRLFGDELRKSKDDLGLLVTLEAGKILSEGLGEVQEMIDICDFAVGLSRQLYGLTMPSERAGHHMRETWQPLGPVGVITAFNFPVAVWAWNAALAVVCGDPTIWKPSEKTPVTALATQVIWERAVKAYRAAGHEAPDNLLQVIIGGRETGEALVNSKEIPLISATGSVPMGRAVGEAVAKRMGRSLLELGGNNAMVIAPSADLNMATRAILFGAVGTAGQRCTTTRRLIVHESIAEKLTATLVKAYGSLRIGDPRAKDTLVGPLIDEQSWKNMEQALQNAAKEGGKILVGGKRLDKAGVYVEPAIVSMTKQSEIMCHETFAPILYILPYKTLDEAIRLNNEVPQGLSSSIFTLDAREAERFLSATGSDCGIANVNIGTSGAEIGGAFGGEKETGGGRESGSDSWKLYMRRQTQTINYSENLPLAQGVVFDL
ncbi:MAG: aldehyde dehydrogenase family protein [Alphaproteobacteria bacterium]|nr:aldehyde dehydrogenase family protein [Alphaproteobacteria bacterium]